MVADLLGRFPLLLFLLGFWGPVHLQHTKLENLTRAQWFEIQHIHPTPLQCNNAMRGVNNYTQHCKPVNTFLHDSFRNVAATCALPTIVCKNGQNNCHNSSAPIMMTKCTLTSRMQYPNCQYSGSGPKSNFYVIACDRPQKNDPPYPLVPVHLD
ncbi:ribonuclease K6 [Erinaceus europaeus]|uniref:Ribonuclease A D1 n=1 Tax=Erinaceus europaeus TaxID=9365 RepID=W0UVK0_ERIEU|nr:ribonuclease K6 [Erinaceus europaeus]XP_060031377.1 ribonuclease K6 [Erinaceus europaeus]CDG32143.1 TPA: ribonuclease A D1 [Erinaceus europaeus]